MCDISGKNEEYYSKFPGLLKDRLMNGELEFPKNTEYNYARIKAYRCVRREDSDCTPIGREDFRSPIEEIEKGIRKLTRGESVKYDAISSYGTSLYMDIGSLENMMHLPRPNKKICEGYVCKDGGPRLMDEKSKHIDWWIYENVDLTGFSLVEG